MGEPLDRDPGPKLLQDLQGGSEAAADEFLRRFGPVVFRIVRRRLGARSPRFDSADVAQAVWASFFSNREKLKEFADADAMLRYLAGMAVNKVRKVNHDHFLVQKRAAAREQSIETREHGRVDEPYARDPSPSQRAIADETWERLLAETPQSQQHILYLRLEGKSQEEIAALLGLSVRTISRIMTRMRERIPL